MDLSVAVGKLNSLDEAKLLIHELIALHQAEIELLKTAIADLQQKQGLEYSYRITILNEITHQLTSMIEFIKFRKSITSRI